MTKAQQDKIHQLLRELGIPQNRFYSGKLTPPDATPAETIKFLKDWMESRQRRKPTPLLVIEDVIKRVRRKQPRKADVAAGRGVQST